MSGSALEGRVKTLEEVAVKIFELILNLVTSLIVLGICLAILAVCWFFGITSDNAVLYFKELANTPIWLMLLAVVGFSVLAIGRSLRHFISCCGIIIGTMWFWVF
ncbi:TPA: hypothetical protein NGR42_004579 [Vibrio parahaemolyticus]|uniref:hypothetical protein n=1 Tax=Vibrio parahaemolyticus TaxID=670 RepID=UPI00111D5782|nr:hypothetical protein [Vibrio parahaemolyticus]ELA8088805.1 hypothetical protein [Vibrio parahaemolyticus]ELA8205912.1 hypothetical protein [Vibrio parahaemolyticus]ELB2030832.1 hypothetical protein [Vibrio parahaemolyticus]ELB2142117.1 hypothetical protein [Vibrio parahaemolyticus]ELB2219881.1 hypothetical protein [Vibrio parahaemolyticus]